MYDHRSGRAQDRVRGSKSSLQDSQWGDKQGEEGVGGKAVQQLRVPHGARSPSRARLHVQAIPRLLIRPNTGDLI